MTTPKFKPGDIVVFANKDGFADEDGVGHRVVVKGFFPKDPDQVGRKEGEDRYEYLCVHYSSGEFDVGGWDRLEVAVRGTVVGNLTSLPSDPRSYDEGYAAGYEDGFEDAP